MAPSVVVSTTGVSSPLLRPKAHTRRCGIAVQRSAARRRLQAPASAAAAAVPLAPFPAAMQACLAASPLELPLPLLGNALMEASRPHLRSVFDVEQWEALRHTDRYFRHMLSLHQSRIFRGLAGPLAYVMGVSLLACTCGAAQQAELLPSLMPALGVQLRHLFTITSGSLSLLLAYRTSSSYARWEEACKMWGQVLNRTRNMSRLVLTWIDGEKRELRSMMLRWAPAFSKALMCHLRKGEDLRKELDGLLLPHEVDGVMRSQHRPNYILQVLSHIVSSAGVPSRVALRMQEDVACFEDCLGGCERLLQTPIPVNYTRHTSRMLIAWMTCLPFAIYSACGLTTIPLTFLIAFLLLGIDKIGVSIEEPFSILALEVISGTALANVRELEAAHGSALSAVQAASGGSSSSSSRGNSPASLYSHIVASSFRIMQPAGPVHHRPGPGNVAAVTRDGAGVA